MSGFRIDGKLRDIVEVNPADREDEPIFLLEREGVVGFVTLDLMAYWLNEVQSGQMEIEEAYERLQIRLPGKSYFQPCEAGFAGSDRNPKLIFTNDALPGVLWTCNL